jgi:hypothetical protein
MIGISVPILPLLAGTLEGTVARDCKRGGETGSKCCGHAGGEAELAIRADAASDAW